MKNKCQFIKNHSALLNGHLNRLVQAYKYETAELTKTIYFLCVYVVSVFPLQLLKGKHT